MYRVGKNEFLAIVFGLNWLVSVCAHAQQQAPAIGYMYPSGGQAGTTVDVVLGGYDWTPDVEVFVHEPQIGLELTSSPGPVIVPEPPYWFGKKARRGPFLLPRETQAKLTIPPDTKPGIYSWQAANANGATATGRFVVSPYSEAVDSEALEQAGRSEPQDLKSLPTVVNAQILKIEEVDRYRFVAPQDGPVTLSLVAAALGSPLTAAVEVRDASGRLVAEATDTAGLDLRMTFVGQAEQAYVISVHDVDFRGNRAYVYRLSVTPGPQVVAAIPAAGKRGETCDVEFVGYGVATGSTLLESVTRKITFPAESTDSVATHLETEFGQCQPFMLRLSDIPELTEAQRNGDEAQLLPIPSAVTGVLEERYGTDQYELTGKKGDVWAIDLQAEAIGSKLDVVLGVFDEQDKELKRVDDLAGTTDVGLEFVVPADGNYRLMVSDSSGHSGNRAATYRLVVRPAEAGYSLTVPEFVNLPIGGKSQLAVQAIRTGGFKDKIDIRVEGLPKGVNTPQEISIPAGKNDVKIELSADVNAGTRAALLQLSSQVTIDDVTVAKEIGPVLLAVTMKPPFSIDAEGKNDVLKWPRGTTFPGPVLIERDEGFTGDIVLEMAAKQGRHRQGIRAPELTIAPEVNRVLYPVFLPEWLETTRTSRMVVNGVAQVADPQGRVRYLSSKLKTRIGFLPTGALFKIACEVPEVEVVAGQAFDIPVSINRAQGLTESANVELVINHASEGVLTAEPLVLADSEAHALLKVVPLVSQQFVGERVVTVRATVMQDGHLPVISETQVLVAFVAAKQN